LACKVPVRVVVRDAASVRVVGGFYHRAGCMGARYPHLDLECVGDMWLCELSRVRGVSLECKGSGGGCAVLLEPFSGLSVRVCVEGGGLGCVGGRVYVMKTRSGMLYIGPLVLSGLEG
jgi:hypothetical protein